MITKATAVLFVEHLEESLPFFEAAGFARTVEVPEGDKLGFVILQSKGAEVMLQSYASAMADVTTLDPKTGAVHKQARLRGSADQYYASPVAGDGKVYAASNSGVVSVLRAGGEQELLAVNDIGEEIFATPAIAAGRLYVRTKSGLYCFRAK